MYSSGIHDESYTAQEDHAAGYRWDEAQKKLVYDDVVSLPVTPADGGLFTTTTDFFKWCRVLAGETKGILSAESIKLMTTGKENTASLDGNYGYGLFIDEFLSTKRIHHPGEIVGFRSHVCLFPEKKIYIAVFCNNITADPMKMTEELSEIIQIHQ